MKLKRFLATVLCVSTIFVTGIGDTVVLAAQEGEVPSVQETEAAVECDKISQTELDQVAIPMTSGVPLMEQSITIAGQENWYKFDMTAPGYMVLHFVLHEDSDADNVRDGWRVRIYKKGDLVEAVREYASVKASLTTLPLSLGTGTFYVQVTEMYSEQGWNTNGSMYNLTMTATTSDTWEWENLDASADSNVNPTLINTDITYTGSTYAGTDVDWYKVTIDKIGYFKVILGLNSGASQIESDGWNMDILDCNLNVLKSYTNIKTRLETPELPFAPGEYYIKICSSNSSAPWAPIDKMYDLIVATTETVEWESEKNDSNAVADAIQVGNTVKGTMYNASDIDWFKFDVTQAGYFTVSFKQDETADYSKIKDGWKLTVYDSNNGLICEYNNITSSMSTMRIPYAKGTYYVRVQNAYDNINWAPIDVVYNLKVNVTASATWESEPNSQRSKADTLKFNTKYNGNMQNSNDQDWYKVTMPKTGYLNVKLGMNNQDEIDNIKDGWRLELYKSGENTVYKYKSGSSYKTVQLTDVISSKSTGSIKLAKGTYYIKVCSDYANDTYAPVGCVYDLTATFAPEKVALSGISSPAAGQLKVTWGKSSNVTGYQVQYSASSSFSSSSKTTVTKTVSKNTTTSLTAKSLQKGKKYYARVRTYYTASGKTYYSSWSSSKSVTLKK